jgi:hypothetical protein
MHSSIVRDDDYEWSILRLGTVQYNLYNAALI